MKTRIDIIAVEMKEGISKASGSRYKNFVCQCVCYLDHIQVGELVISDKLMPEGVNPGSYMAEYGLNVNWQTKKLEGQLKSLSPVSSKAAVGLNQSDKAVTAPAL